MTKHIKVMSDPRFSPSVSHLKPQNLIDLVHLELFLKPNCSNPISPLHWMAISWVKITYNHGITTFFLRIHHAVVAILSPMTHCAAQMLHIHQMFSNVVAMDVSPQSTDHAKLPSYIAIQCCHPIGSQET